MDACRRCIQAPSTLPCRSLPVSSASSADPDGHTLLQRRDLLFAFGSPEPVEVSVRSCFHARAPCKDHLVWLLEEGWLPLGMGGFRVPKQTKSSPSLLKPEHIFQDCRVAGVLASRGLWVTKGSHGGLFGRQVKIQIIYTVFKILHSLMRFLLFQSSGDGA